MIDPLRILVAPVVWLAAFSAVYGLQGVLCAAPPEGTVAGLPMARVLLALSFAAALLVQVALLVLLLSRRFGASRGFVRTVSLGGGLVGVVATVWTLFPVLALPLCQ